MERGLVDDRRLRVRIRATVPSQTIYIIMRRDLEQMLQLTHRRFWANAFHNDANRVRKAYRIMRGVGCNNQLIQRKGIMCCTETCAWKQEHLALLDANVAEDPVVDDAQEHPTLVFVEPFLV